MQQYLTHTPSPGFYRVIFNLSLDDAHWTTAARNFTVTFNILQF